MEISFVFSAILTIPESFNLDRDNIGSSNRSTFVNDDIRNETASFLRPLCLSLLAHAVVIRIDLKARKIFSKALGHVSRDRALVRPHIQQIPLLFVETTARKLN